MGGWAQLCQKVGGIFINKMAQGLWFSSIWNLSAFILHPSSASRNTVPVTVHHFMSSFFLCQGSMVLPWEERERRSWRFAWQVEGSEARSWFRTQLPALLLSAHCSEGFRSHPIVCVLSPGFSLGSREPMVLGKQHSLSS